MSAYNPPVENVPIFDAGLFSTTNSSTTGLLTKDEADRLYLQFPFGQGSETIPSLNVSGNQTTTGNIIMNGISGTNYLEFPDGTKQFTSNAPPTDDLQATLTAGNDSDLSIVLKDDLTTPTTTNTISSSSIAFNTTSGEVAGSYLGNSFSLQTDATGSSVGIANLSGSAVNTTGTLISGVGGGIVGIASPPYPAPDANWSLGVNSSTNNPALGLSKSAPFENSTSMTLDLNNLTHNQGTGSVSPDDNFTISTNKNLILTADNIDLSATGRLIVPSLASGDYLDYNTGKLTIVNDSVGGTANPLLVLQNNNTTANPVVIETYKNDTPISTGGDTIASWSANCNTTIGGVPTKTEIARINQIVYGVGASNNDGGIALACKVNSAISNFLICNGGASTGEIQVFKPITTTSPNNIDITCPTAGGSINLTSVSSVNITATGDNLALTAGSAMLLETTGTGTNIEFKPESSAGGIVFTGTALQSSSSGSNSGEHLVITLNGVQYKIKLEHV